MTGFEKLGISHKFLKGTYEYFENRQNGKRWIKISHFRTQHIFGGKWGHKNWQFFQLELGYGLVTHSKMKK